MVVIKAFKGTNFQAELLEAIDCATGITLVNSHQFDCILIDYRLPDGNGCEIWSKRGLLEGGYEAPPLQVNCIRGILCPSSTSL